MMHMLSGTCNRNDPGARIKRSDATNFESLGLF